MTGGDDRNVAAVDPAWKPLVTLGLPVHNGERYVEAAIRGLQAQTWPDLEILISDNASTDGTEAICRRLAAEDGRIRVVFQPQNIGAARNFDFLAREARGELFAWCAHDDLRLPGFVEACVAELRRRPEAVLCNSAIVYLDEEGRERGDLHDLNFATQAMTLPERAERLIDHFHWAEMYGLIRTEALRRAMPWEPVWGCDVALSMKLLTMGDFAKVTAPLFHYRVRSRHPTPQLVMKGVFGAKYTRRDPYTEMYQVLLRVAVMAATTPEEAGDVLWRFLRMATRSDSPGWRSVLRDEHRLQLGLDPAPLARHVLGWLAEGLPFPSEWRGRAALSLLLASARRVRIVMEKDDLPPEALAELVATLRARSPSAEVSVASSGLDELRPPGSPGAVDNPAMELVVCPSWPRSTRLEQMVAGIAPLLAIGVTLWKRPRRVGMADRSGRSNPDIVWAYEVPASGGLPALIRFLRDGDALGPEGRLEVSMTETLRVRFGDAVEKLKGAAVLRWERLLAGFRSALPRPPRGPGT